MFETTRRPKPLASPLNPATGFADPEASPIAPRPTPTPTRIARGLDDPSAASQSPAAEPTVAGIARSGVRPSPAQPPTLPDTWKPTLNSGTGQQGEPTYDQASVEKLASRPGIQLPSPNAAPPVAARPQPSDAILPPTLIPRPSPRVASTFGQPVTAMPDNFTGPAMARRPEVAYREPGDMGEQYNSTEDRRSREKQLSSLDSQRFALEMKALNPGRKGRAAIEALSANAGQQNELVNEGARLTADAIANRAKNNTTLANTGLEQSGQDRRAQFGVEANAATSAADRDQQLGIATMNDATERAKQGKLETLTGADGTVYRITGDGTASAVTDADGNKVRAPVARDSSALSVADQLDSVGGELKAATEQLTAMAGINGSATPEQVKAQQDYVTRLQGDLGTLRGGGGAGSSATSGNRQKPSLEQFMTRAKAQGSKMTPQQLQAYYDQMQ